MNRDAYKRDEHSDAEGMSLPQARHAGHLQDSTVF